MSNQPEAPCLAHSKADSEIDRQQRRLTLKGKDCYVNDS